jgi:hypothetical protein
LSVSVVAQRLGGVDPSVAAHLRGGPRTQGYRGATSISAIGNEFLWIIALSRQQALRYPVLSLISGDFTPLSASMSSEPE